jgi:hypothetical protein
MINIILLFTYTTCTCKNTIAIGTGLVCGCIAFTIWSCTIIFVKTAGKFLASYSTFMPWTLLGIYPYPYSVIISQQAVLGEQGQAGQQQAQAHSTAQRAEDFVQPCHLQYPPVKALRGPVHLATVSPSPPWGDIASHCQRGENNGDSLAEEG